MSKSDRQKKREQRRNRHAKPSMPRVIGANDNHANDNTAPVMIRGVTLTEGQAFRFTNAEAKLADGNLAIKRDGQRMMLAIEAEIEATLKARGTAADLEELRVLEALRGGEIVASRIEGAHDVPEATRDGLKNLTRPWTDRETGDKMPAAIPVDGTLYAAALLYRADYERIDPERLLTPPQLDPAKANIGHGGDHWAEKRREIERRLFRVHLMIAGVAPGPDGRGAMPNLPAGNPSMRAIHALQQIAGKGRALSDMTTSGFARTRIKDDLLRALEVCEIVYGLA